MSIKYKIQFYFFALIAIMIPFIAKAQILGKLKSVGGSAGFNDEGDPEATFSDALGTIIGALLSLLGVIFVVLMLYGGFNWMTAGGREEKVNVAKDTIRRAIIGLIITISSYAIWFFIYYYVLVGGP